ncbi:serine hydroxymethyltransferase [Streptacidiphilus sp. ASG 303]|uniref:serine hydroxymethyltransferase n=1 Tax=Streptacidiphilus sp. ASG 303 TaxID=2896847 RepID=UPI001E5B0803|nr:serine hydroxymethyltransferase [Streptacidiphilus sp. ASG 303]MCD0482951.1 serine hydroxymethyltransferase [Streptacidiphilus sp. ASG 303]
MTVTEPPHAPARTPLWEAPEALRRTDPQIADVLAAEAERRRDCLQLLAGENTASEAVLAALAGPLAHKYAEGYPGRRHHTGCAAADAAELLAVERARNLFGADHANVQPYTGTTAMLAAYAALLRPGDRVLAMSLQHGGHLTVGSQANFSGRWFQFTGYGVRRDDGLIDLDQVRDLARRHRPKAIVAGSITYPRHIDWAAFREIADEVGAYLVATAAQTLGLAAGGAAPSPVPYADVVAAVTHKMLRGPRGGLLLCTAELAERVDRAVSPFIQGGPSMHEVAAKAVAFAEAATPRYRDYVHAAVDNARALAAGLAGQGVRPLTGGTDTHLVTADVSALGITGREAERRCAAAGILLGKCALPYDTAPPAETSGLRLGTGCVTTAGLGAAEMAEAAVLAGRALRTADGGGELAARVRELARGPVPKR